MPARSEPGVGSFKTDRTSACAATSGLTACQTISAAATYINAPVESGGEHACDQAPVLLGVGEDPRDVQLRKADVGICPRAAPVLADNHAPVLGRDQDTAAVARVDLKGVHGNPGIGEPRPALAAVAADEKAFGAAHIHAVGIGRIE